MDHSVNEIRKFNRFYTALLGILDRHFLESDYSLSEVRVLYEIGEAANITAQGIGQTLGLNKGYLSRILKRLEKNDLIVRHASPADGRVFQIGLTTQGQQLLNELHQRSDHQIQGILEVLDSDEIDRLVGAVQTVRHLLSPEQPDAVKIPVIREELKPGDIGYLIHLHGRLYAEESGFSPEFEQYVLKTFVDFYENHPVGTYRFWIAEYQDRIVGSIAILSRQNHAAQLRWFIVHPLFRGTGLGKELLGRALDYCRANPYERVFLFTTDMQKQAIALYERAGFERTASEETEVWGMLLREERYELKLR